MPPGEDRGAIILAGGDSKRLGLAKAMLKLDGATLIERAISRLGTFFCRVTVVTDQPELFSNLPVRVASDLLAGYAKNPLRGIHAGLSALNLPHQFVIACDMPFINLELIGYMAQFASRYDVVVPRVERYYQPLHAFYSCSCIQPIQEQLEQGGGKIISFYRSVEVRAVDWEEIKRFDPQGWSFFNINSWADYRKARRLSAITRSAKAFSD